MNVASLELSKTLYKLSGWDGCRDGYSKYPAPAPIDHEYRLETRSNPDSPKRGSIPAYDCGYLLRKLPFKTDLRQVRKGKGWSISWSNNTYRMYGDARCDASAKADTPENALCQLAIELFKQGVLKRGEA